MGLDGGVACSQCPSKGSRLQSLVTLLLWHSVLKPGFLNQDSCGTKSQLWRVIKSTQRDVNRMLMADSANDGMHLHFLKAVLEDVVRPYEL